MLMDMESYKAMEENLKREIRNLKAVKKDERKRIQNIIESYKRKFVKGSFTEEILMNIIRDIHNQQIKKDSTDGSNTDYLETRSTKGLDNKQEYVPGVVNNQSADTNLPPIVEKIICRTPTKEFLRLEKENGNDINSRNTKFNWTNYCATNENRNQCSKENCTMFSICLIKNIPLQQDKKDKSISPEKDRKRCGIIIAKTNGTEIQCGTEMFGKKRYCLYCSEINKTEELKK